MKHHILACVGRLCAYLEHLLVFVCVGLINNLVIRIKYLSMCKEGKHIYLCIGFSEIYPQPFFFIKHFYIFYFLFTTIGGYYSPILQIKKCVNRYFFNFLLTYAYLHFLSSFSFQCQLST